MLPIGLIDVDLTIVQGPVATMVLASRAANGTSSSIIIFARAVEDFVRIFSLLSTYL
jgi:hypothetical protein